MNREGLENESSADLLSKCLNTQGWAMPRSGTVNSIQVSYIDNIDKTALAIKFS